MKTCPVCDTDYPDQHATCPTDGAVLIGSHELAPGSLVRGKYRIVCKLGEGGMGVVYLAEDILLGVRVALKFLAGDLGKDPKFIKRFRMEARAAYQLRHPNIVEVTNLDQGEDGSLFIAMEYVEGPTLRAVLEQAPGTLAVPRAIEIARGIAAGLAAAHAQGTVHRDIKPENILLPRAAGGRERPKILDFGIAAVAESVTRLTRTHGFLLTPDYAAPEQWQEMPADEMDGRTDLYALGCVVYEMLTGKPPFHAHNTAGWMKQHLEEVPRAPSLLRPELADWQGLDALVLRQLGKDRNQRPQDAVELLSLLDAVRHAPARERRQTVAEDDRKRTETVAEPTGVRTETVAEASVRPETIVEKTTLQSEPGPEQTPEQTKVQPPAPVFAVLEPDSARFPGWAWGAVAILALLVGFGAWRVFAPKPQSQQAEAPTTQPVPQQETVTQQPGQVATSKAPSQSPGASEQPKPTQAQTPKSSIRVPEVPSKPRPVPAQESKAPVPQPEAPAQPNPTSAEGPKPPVRSLSAAEAEQQAETLDKEKRSAEAAPLYDQACAGGNPQACRQLGGLYLAGKGVAKDTARTATLYTKACEGGDAIGCIDLGVLYEKGIVPHDRHRAGPLYAQACDLNLMTACDNLGAILISTSGNAAFDGVDRSRAEALITKGCDAGSARSCEWLGTLYERYWGDNSRALASYAKSCDAGNEFGCFVLGTRYYSGDTLFPKDLNKSKQFYNKSCSLGYQPGCNSAKYYFP